MFDPSAGKMKISRDVIFNKNLSGVQIIPSPCNDLFNIDTLNDSREGGDAAASNDRATASNSIKSTGRTESTDGEDTIIEPFHGFHQPEVSEDASQQSVRIRKKPDRLIEYPTS